jgi:hypothetical protein
VEVPTCHDPLLHNKILLYVLNEFCKRSGFKAHVFNQHVTYSLLSRLALLYQFFLLFLLSPMAPYGYSCAKIAQGKESTGAGHAGDNVEI